MLRTARENAVRCYKLIDECNHHVVA